MNIAVSILKKSLHHIFFRIKLKSMDDIWYIMGGNCFGLFPPSFYYTHTEKEIELITSEKIEKIKKMTEQIRALKNDSVLLD